MNIARMKITNLNKTILLISMALTCNSASAQNSDQGTVPLGNLLNKIPVNKIPYLNKVIPAGNGSGSLQQSGVNSLIQGAGQLMQNKVLPTGNYSTAAGSTYESTAGQSVSNFSQDSALHASGDNLKQKALSGIERFMKGSQSGPKSSSASSNTPMQTPAQMQTLAPTPIQTPAAIQTPTPTPIQTPAAIQTPTPTPSAEASASNSYLSPAAAPSTPAAEESTYSKHTSNGTYTPPAWQKFGPNTTTPIVESPNFVDKWGLAANFPLQSTGGDDTDLFAFPSETQIEVKQRQVGSLTDAKMGGLSVKQFMQLQNSKHPRLRGSRNMFK